MVRPTKATVEFNIDTQVYDIFLDFPEGKVLAYNLTSEFGKTIYFGGSLEKLLNMCINGVEDRSQKASHSL